MRLPIFALGLALAGCSAAAPSTATSEVQNLTSTPVSTETLTFGASGAPTTSASIGAGSAVTVNYAAERLLTAHPECVTNSGYEGSALAEIKMGFRFNGDASRSYWYDDVAVSATSDTGRPRLRNVIPLPGDVSKLEVWFSCGANTTHDQIFDSQDGANYVFTVTPETKVQTKKTGTGNSIDYNLAVGAQVESGDHYYSPYVVTITYDDLTAFVGTDYTEIHAWIDTTTKTFHHGGYPSGDAPVTSGQTITLTRQASGLFQGSFTLDLGGNLSDTQTQLESVAVGVTNDQGGWDSNYGQNYSF